MSDINLGSAGPPKCLIPECSNKSAPVCNTGLCLTCHSKAKKMVEGGSTTWAELVKLGLALSPEASVDPFTRALNDARRGKDANRSADGLG